MEQIILDAEVRGVGRHPVRELRDVQRVPAVVYGASTEAQAIAVNAKALQKALRAAGSGLLTLEIAGQAPVRVLTREVQRDPIKHHVLHVDFHAVSMTEKLRLHIPVLAEGVAPAIETNGDLVLVRVMDSVEIECMASDIPNHLVASLAKLQTVDDEILASDLALPDGVRIMTAHDHVVFSLTLSRAGIVEEEEVAEAPAATTEVEVVIKGKAAKEVEEGAPERK